MPQVSEQRIADSEYGWLIHVLNLETDRQTDAACLFLEGKGLRFCVDYGTENAQSIAEDYEDWKLARWSCEAFGQFQKGRFQ